MQFDQKTTAVWQANEAAVLYTVVNEGRLKGSGFSAVYYKTGMKTPRILGNFKTFAEAKAACEHDSEKIRIGPGIETEGVVS